VWSSFNVFELSVEQPEQPGKSYWDGRFDPDSNDIQIRAELDDGRNLKHGNIMMVGGRVLALRGPIAQSGYEIDSLDAPVLYYQLVIRLLGAAVPKGSEGTLGVSSIDFKDDKTGIQFATPSAGGFIQAPWRVTGHINVTEHEVVEYDLVLTSAKGGGSPTDFHFIGKLSKTPSARIDDATSLEGWSVFGVGVQSRSTETQGTIYDYSAAPEKRVYNMIADVRKEIAQGDYPGELDPSKDFTGFWKSNCNDAFGLSIAHYGTEGKYTVTFCGPGGCGDPSEERKTFISKDPEYEVVSESELRVGNADHREIYRKCTNDIHPVLRYKHK